VLARRVCAATGTSFPSSSSTSRTGAVPNARLKGNVLVPGLLVGDWARKYERIGELPGEGIDTRCGTVVPEGGVGKSKVELAEPDDADETDAERFLPVREEAIGMGSE